MRILAALLITLWALPAYAGGDPSPVPFKSRSQVRSYLNDRIASFKVQSRLSARPDAPNILGATGKPIALHQYRKEMNAQLKRQAQMGGEDAQQYQEALNLNKRGLGRKLFSIAAWTAGVFYLPDLVIKTIAGNTVHGMLKDNYSQGKVLQARGLAAALKVGGVQPHPQLLKEAKQILKGSLVESNQKRKEQTRTFKNQSTYVSLLQGELAGLKKDGRFSGELKAQAEKVLKTELETALKNKQSTASNLKETKATVRSTWSDLLTIKQHQ